MLDKEWIPKVALDEMNAVHDEEVDLLIELLNRLDGVAEGKLPPRALDAPLAALLEHMRNHFAGEEERMAEARFPAYAVHKAAHDRALAEAHFIYQAWLTGRDEAALYTYLRRTFPAWMIQHVTTMDAVTARFLASQGEPYRTAS
ncbi:hemerythrin [Sulfurifustis variabilis]|uniref:Hemerythrin n=1 Tax=Sulfurifustis variabilis TaxID=1675686 RepID=A0A1B4V6K1_9GAMM|nr:hemerythrin family protein [Sulfurifustis variabilis]BAU49186.1 hemerythrin [Sulfurifustis variabilis]